MTANIINHVTLAVASQDIADTFYQPLLRFLGYHRAASGDGMRVWRSGEGRCSLVLYVPLVDGLAEIINLCGIRHVGFAAESRQQVDDCHALLCQLPGHIRWRPRDCDEKPGYAVFFESPDGTLLELAYDTEDLTELGDVAEDEARREG